MLPTLSAKKCASASHGTAVNVAKLISKVRITSPIKRSEQHTETSAGKQVPLPDFKRFHLLTVLLIALVTTGAILLGLLAVCLGMACFRHPGRNRRTGDRRAMIPGTGGDTSSEGSVTDLAIPHHVPHVLPPPPQMIAPLPPTNKRPIRKISGKPRHPPRKATMIPATGKFCCVLILFQKTNLARKKALFIMYI